jgi:DNA-binding XRE family transcriptional regulator
VPSRKPILEKTSAFNRAQRASFDEAASLVENKIDPFSTFNLKSWRNRNNYTQDELAKEVGVSRQTIISWEKGHVPITRAIYLALIALEFTPQSRTIITKTKK